MVRIDVTSPFVAGMNAANESAGQSLANRNKEIEQGLAREQLDLGKKVASQRAALAEEEMAQRRAEIERLAQERDGQTAGYEQYAGIQGQQFQPHDAGVPTGNDAFFGGKLGTGTYAHKDESQQLEDFLQNQRDTIGRYAATLSPSARNAFYKTHLPLLLKDEQDERAGLATRAMRRRLVEVKNSGMLDEEEGALIDQAMQGLETGAEDVGSVQSMMRDLQRSVKRRLTRQQNYQWGTQWAQQQISEAAQGGVDPAPLHEAFSDWITSDDLDPQKLKKAIVEKRYGIKTPVFKVGRAEIPHDATVDDWASVADVEAEQEARTLVSKDPRFKLDQSGLDAAIQTEKRRILKKYAVQAHLPVEVVDRYFPDKPKELGDDEIRAKLKAAGIDPDMEMPTPSLKDKKLDPAKVRAWIPAADPPEPAKPQPDGRDVNGDGVYDEEDLGGG